MEYQGSGVPPDEPGPIDQPRATAPLGEPAANPWPHGQHQQQTEFGTTDVPLEQAHRGNAGKLGGLAGGGFLVF
ncbi:MAG: hypothetical protein NVSMB17_18980 [Candidatus Dormibacteria bacterium]